MNWIKFSQWLLKGCLAIALLLTVSIANATLIFAQNERSGSNGGSEILFEPPDKGTPHSEDGTGSRGDCPTVELGMKSIVGENSRFQLAANPFPTFWVYVPYTREQVPTGKFVLQDEAGENQFWETDFQLPEKTGIVGISLPTSEQPLVPGKVYRWYFEVNCPGKSSNEEITPISVTGLVEFVPRPELQNQLNSTSLSIERAKIYAENGIWYDTITELVKLREELPENRDYENNWIELLSNDKVGLKKWARQPIVEVEIITNSPPK